MKDEKIDLEFIERAIVLGLITDTDYIKQIRPIWNTRFIKSGAAKRLAQWCIEYFDKYKKNPGLDIEAIFYQKVRDGLPKEIAEEIEEDILPGLSEEYSDQETPINIQYLTDQTDLYFRQRHLDLHNEDIKALLSEGEIVKAELKASNYKILARNTGKGLDLSNPEVLLNLERAFEAAGECLITFPGALGDFWNHQLTRGSFVALLGAEKRGKSFWLLEFAIRAAKQKRKVAFFQAGDMTEGQQLRRISINLARKSDLEQYCGEMLEPVKDCVLNQIDSCTKKERECVWGVFAGAFRKDIRENPDFDKLKMAYIENPDYRPCTNCHEWEKGQIGATWFKTIEATKPLTFEESSKIHTAFFIKTNRHFMLSTYTNNTLTAEEMRNTLGIWREQLNFVPEVIIVDFADLMVDSSSRDFRHQQNNIWKDLRSINQETNSLLITVSMADAKSYTQGLLNLNNFSEDKRKYGHVTGFYGLNQDPDGHEKKIGIMRINELLIREGAFHEAKQVYVLQNLKRGLPFIGSYF